MKLGTVKPKLQLAPTKRRKATVSSVRMTGRRLQDRRLRMWSANPHCAACGQYTLFPHGFELDHKVPLHQGGEDTEANLQVLCVQYDDMGRKIGCHVEKTADDLD